MSKNLPIGLESDSYREAGVQDIFNAEKFKSGHF
jgi:hypothetical protein